MSKEKQIEEMELTPLDVLANDIYQHCPDLKENYCGYTHCVACLANALYNAGYRKQEWISIEDRFPDADKALFWGRTGLWFLEVKVMSEALQIVIADKGFTHWMPLSEPPKKGGVE